MSDKPEIQKLGDPYDFDFSQLGQKDIGILYHFDKNALDITRGKDGDLAMSRSDNKNDLDISHSVPGSLEMSKGSGGKLSISPSGVRNLEMIARGVLIYHPIGEYLPAVKDFLQNSNDLTCIYIGSNTINSIYAQKSNVYTKTQINNFFEGETGSGKKQVDWNSITNKPDFVSETGEGRIKISADDTTANYLENKFIVSHGTNATYPLTLSTLSPGSDEKRQLQLDISKINHDGLLNFVLNEHINHSNVSIIAGTGLSDGGDITQSRTLNVMTQMSITYDENGIKLVGDSDSPGNKKYFGTHPTTGEKGWYSGGLISFGSDNQIPSVNATGDDFEYSSDLVFTATGLGIGTASPGVKLEVNSLTSNATGLFKTSTEGARVHLERVNNTKDTWLGFRSEGENNWLIGLENNRQNLEFYRYSNFGGTLGNTGGTAMVIDPDGKVGIGTYDPQISLHIYGNAPAMKIEDDNGAFISLSTHSTTTTSYINTSGILYINSALSFMTDEGKMTLGANLSLDFLNIASPDDGIELRLREGEINGTSYIGFKAPDNISTSVTYTFPEIGTPGYFLKLDDSSGTLVWATPGEGFEDPMTTAGDMIYRNTSNITDRLAVDTEGKILTVTNIGGVLVPRWQNAPTGLTIGGDDSPTGQIQYRSSGNFAACDYFYFDASPNYDLYVLGSKTGIKTATFRNTHNGSASAMELLLKNDQTNSFYLKLNSSNFSSAQNYAYVWQELNAPLIFGTNDTERIRISGDTGFVGIGKTASTLLDVNGVIAAQGGNSEEWNQAYAAKHTRSHSITSTNDHTSSATAERILKANASGLPVESTYSSVTDLNVFKAVSWMHQKNQDTALGSGCIAQDHGAESTPMVGNIVYGTGDPPSPAGIPDGTIFIKYIP